MNHQLINQIKGFFSLLSNIIIPQDRNQRFQQNNLALKFISEDLLDQLLGLLESPFLILIVLEYDDESTYKILLQIGKTK